MDTAFFSIKWAHESAGQLLESATDNPLVNRVREAAKRILGAKRCHTLVCRNYQRDYFCR